jgi:hypothetical protein
MSLPCQRSRVTCRRFAVRLAGQMGESATELKSAIEGAEERAREDLESKEHAIMQARKGPRIHIRGALSDNGPPTVVTVVTAL